MSSHLRLSRGSIPPGLAANGWDLSPIVKELRAASRSLTSGKTLLDRHELPSHDALVAIARALRAVLFPAHFGPSDLTDAPEW